MALYIRLDDAIRPYENKSPSDFHQDSVVAESLKALPSIEIVHCGECKYSTVINGKFVCTFTAQLIEKHHFCYFGTR